MQSPSLSLHHILGKGLSPGCCWTILLLLTTKTQPCLQSLWESSDNFQKIELIMSYCWELKLLSCQCGRVESWQCNEWQFRADNEWLLRADKMFEVGSWDCVKLKRCWQCSTVKSCQSASSASSALPYLGSLSSPHLHTALSRPRDSRAHLRSTGYSTAHLRSTG